MMINLSWGRKENGVERDHVVIQVIVKVQVFVLSDGFMDVYVIITNYPFLLLIAS